MKRLMGIVFVLVFVLVIYILGKEFYKELKEIPGSPYDRTWAEKECIKINIEDNKKVSDLLELTTQYVYKLEKTKLLKNVEVRFNRETSEIIRYIFSYKLEPIDNYFGSLQVYLSPADEGWKIDMGLIDYTQIEYSADDLSIINAEMLLEQGMQYLDENDYIVGDECDISISSEYVFFTMLYRDGDIRIKNGPRFEVSYFDGIPVLEEIVD